MNCRVVDAQPVHVGMMSRYLREDDRIEIAAGAGDVRRAIRLAYRASAYRRAAFVDDELAALWGVEGGLFATDGHPWLITAPAIERVPLTFAREGRRELSDMLRTRLRLVSHVQERYEKAIRFMRLLGFTIGRRFELNGEPFRELVMENEAWQGCRS